MNDLCRQSLPSPCGIAFRLSTEHKSAASSRVGVPHCTQRIFAPTQSIPPSGAGPLTRWRMPSSARPAMAGSSPANPNVPTPIGFDFSTPRITPAMWEATRQPQRPNSNWLRFFNSPNHSGQVGSNPPTSRREPQLASIFQLPESLPPTGKQPANPTARTLIGFDFSTPHLPPKGIAHAS